MGILRKLPEGLAAEGFGSGEFTVGGEFSAWASSSPPGTEAASKPLVAARNSLRPKAEFLGCFFMRLLGKRGNGASTDVSAALYVTVTRKQAGKIVFLLDTCAWRETKRNRQKSRPPRSAAARDSRKKGLDSG